jgi:hypothetical protein
MLNYHERIVNPQPLRPHYAPELAPPLRHKPQAIL